MRECEGKQLNPFSSYLVLNTYVHCEPGSDLLHALQPVGDVSSRLWQQRALPHGGVLSMLDTDKPGGGAVVPCGAVVRTCHDHRRVTGRVEKKGKTERGQWDEGGRRECDLEHLTVILN